MTFSVQVSRAEMANALRTLAKLMNRNQPAEALVSFVDGALQFELPGGEVGVAAEGEWDEEVRVPGSFFLRYAKALPEVDPLRVEVRGDRFSIAGISVRCVVQKRAERIQLPLDPPMLEILRMLARHSDDEIEQSGLTPLVGHVRAQFCEMGMPSKDFDCFVDELLRKRED